MDFLPIGTPLCPDVPIEGGLYSIAKQSVKQYLHRSHDPLDSPFRRGAKLGGGWGGVDVLLEQKSKPASFNSKACLL